MVHSWQSVVESNDMSQACVQKTEKDRARRSASRLPAMSASPRESILEFLSRHGHDDAREHVVVLGNGPVKPEDHNAIQKAKTLIAFNDMNSLAHGERPTVRVVRHPSWYSLSTVHVDTYWHIAPTRYLQKDPASYRYLSYVYERQHGEDDSNVLPSTSRIFPSCVACGDACFQNGTYAGPSSGGAVLSELSEAGVKKIDVYGMNWGGSSGMHVDFKHPHIVKQCCTACVFHATASDAYSFGTPLLIVVIVIAVALCFLTFGSWRVVSLERRMLSYNRPLIALARPTRVGRTTTASESAAETTACIIVAEDGDAHAACAAVG